jgi:hypothetical protein
MPAVPCRSLGCRVSNVTKKLKKKFVRYAVFAIILLEVFSLLFNKSSFYTLWLYDLLVQLTSVIFVLVLLLRPIKLELCSRKKLAYKVMGLYYLFGMFSIIFKIGASYNTLANTLLLSTAGILILISLKNE